MAAFQSFRQPARRGEELESQPGNFVGGNCSECPQNCLSCSSPTRLDTRRRRGSNMGRKQWTDQIDRTKLSEPCICCVSRILSHSQMDKEQTSIYKMGAEFIPLHGVVSWDPDFNIA